MLISSRLSGHSKRCDPLAVSRALPHGTQHTDKSSTGSIQKSATYSSPATLPISHRSRTFLQLSLERSTAGLKADTGRERWFRLKQHFPPAVSDMDASSVQLRRCKPTNTLRLVAASWKAQKYRGAGLSPPWWNHRFYISPTSIF